VDEADDEALEAALAKGLKQSEAGLATPHEEFWPEVLARFKR
jgi:predicted transcriptional regulator